MAEKLLNCKGLACPQPVLETKKALEELPAGAVLTVVVDNAAAKENVTLFAANAGHLVQAAEGNGEYVLTITKGGKEAAPPGEAKEPGGRGQKERGAGLQGKTVFLVTSNILGQGSPDLGQTLMKSFFTAVAEQEPPPKALIFLNTGVFLTARDSGVLGHLQKIAGKGAALLSCGTCLDYYKLKEKLAVGRVSNMYEILELVSSAEKVVTIA
jgi:selenium metabolism protein YedF